MQFFARLKFANFVKSSLDFGQILPDFFGSQKCRKWRRKKENYVYLILRSQKMKYFGWWIWKTSHFEKSILSSRSPPRNFVWNIPHPKKFRLNYQGARDVILRKSHSRPTHAFYWRKPSHFHQHGPPRRLLMPIPYWITDQWSLFQ